jgi:hypothetical protein
MEPSQQRIAEYELKRDALYKGGGHMMDFFALERLYGDVIEYKNKIRAEKPAGSPSETAQ